MKGTRPEFRTSITSMLVIPEYICIELDSGRLYTASFLIANFDPKLAKLITIAITKEKYFSKVFSSSRIRIEI